MSLARPTDGGAPAGWEPAGRVGRLRSPARSDRARVARAPPRNLGVWQSNVNQPELGQRGRDGPEAALAYPGLPQDSGERGPLSARRAGAETAAPAGVWQGYEKSQGDKPSDRRDDAR